MQIRNSEGKSVCVCEQQDTVRNTRAFQNGCSDQERALPPFLAPADDDGDRNELVSDF